MVAAPANCARARARWRAGSAATSSPRQVLRKRRQPRRMGEVAA